MTIIPFPVNEVLEKELSLYQDRFSDLKAEASDIRKTGRDTFMFDTKMLDFPSVLKIARATYDAVDVAKVKHLLEDLKHELSLAKDGEPFEHVLLLISQITMALGQDEFAKARALYVTLTDIYKILPKEEKQLVVDACASLREKVLAGGG